MSEQGFASWAVVELFGHRRLAGWCQEERVAGADLLRIDVPGENGDIQFSQLYGAAAIFSITPVDEETARRVATASYYRPHQAWALPAGPIETDYDDVPYDDDAMEIPY